MDKPQFFHAPETPGRLMAGFYWNDPQLLAGNIGPFPTQADAEMDWMAAHMIEGCRQDLHALNIAVDMPVLNLNQADIDLMLDIQQTREAVEEYAA